MIEGVAEGTIVLFVKMNNNSLQLCIDYQELNMMTIKDKYCCHALISYSISCEQL